MHVLYTSDATEIPQSLREKLEIYGPGTVTFQMGSIEGAANRQADTVTDIAATASVHSLVLTNFS
jgi:hypothetical protein